MKRRPHFRKRPAPRPTVKNPWVDCPLFVRKLKFHIIDDVPEVNLIDPDTGLVCYTTPSLPDAYHARQRATRWAWRQGFRLTPKSDEHDFLSFAVFLKRGQPDASHC